MTKPKRESGSGLERARLFVLADQREPSEALLSALKEHFEVVRVDAARAAEAVWQGEHVSVMADAAELTGLGRALTVAQERGLLESIGEAACLYEAGGRIVWASPLFMELDVQTRERVMEACERAGSWLDAGFGESGVRGSAHRQRVVSTDQRAYEVLVARASAGRGAGNADGAWRVAAVVRDVTAMHRTQQKIDALDRAGQELVRLESDQVRRMHVHDRLDFLRKKIVQLAHDLLQFDHFVIYLLDPDGRKLELVMSSGLRQGVQDIQLYASKEGNGISGYVGATGRSYICHDAAKDPRYIRGMDTPGSSLTTPLTLDDKVIGVFNVESNRVGAFTEDDRHFAEIFARHVAMALHMLNLLVAERIVTNEAVAGRMEGELQEPLNDLAVEAEWLKEQALAADPAVAEHVARIIRDVEAIRKRVREVSKGAKSILGVDQELASSSEDPLLSGRRVLVADDDEEIRGLIRDVLTKRGAVVTVCATGGEAVTILEEAYAGVAGGSASRKGGPDSKGFRLIVSDIRMPDKNGYEVFSTARRLDTSLPVILMTGFGYDPHHSIVRASQEGLQCVLFKPFQVDKLIEEVHKAMSAN